MDENEKEWETPDPVKVVALEQAVAAIDMKGTLVSHYHSMVIETAAVFEKYLRGTEQ